MPVYNVPMHKCAGCDRQIPEHVKFCMFCGRDLNKRGLCAMCGTKSRKPRAKNGQQSKYCELCQAIAIDLANKRSYSRSDNYRPPEARENTYETKHGTEH